MNRKRKTQKLVPSWPSTIGFSVAIGGQLAFLIGNPTMEGLMLHGVFALCLSYLWVVEDKARKVVNAGIMVEDVVNHVMHLKSENARLSERLAEALSKKESA